MIRPLSMFLLCGGLLLTACSKREKSNAEEWNDIQALDDGAVLVPMNEKTPTKEAPESAGEFAEYIQRLEEMRSISREPGETLLTGEHLILNQDTRLIQMDENVVVLNDRGTLKADRLEGRFTVSNEVEYVEAKGRVRVEVLHPEGRAQLNGDRLVLDRDRRQIQMDGNVVVTDARGKLWADHLTGTFSVSNEVEAIAARGHVQMESDGRTAAAENVDYNFKTGFVRLEGQATAADGANRLSGERILLWTQGGRKMICEPNAVLKISGASGLQLGGVPAGDTEIRANRVVYDESKRLAELDGNVRVRDPRAALNCGKMRLHLKADNEIDWIEAMVEVIIQSDERKALADRASYYANEGRFVLDGDPKVKQGRNIMTGDRIIFWLEPQRMVCEPNAHALLYLDEETKAKFLKDLKD